MKNDGLIEARLTCPSSPIDVGGQLIGIVLKNGLIAYSTEECYVDEDLFDSLTELDSAEKMFRFASPCRQSGCRQWISDHCGVAKDLVLMNREIEQVKSTLPACVIRDHCRWFVQEQEKACAVCKYVITDSA